ncbi:MAG: ferredoxin-thioredoxin reductase variable chain [Microcoleaceae cyanobacterium]
MEIGNSVKVKTSVIIYTHPENKGQPFDIQGSQGEIVAILKEWQGRPISANFPVVVQFAKNFKVHLRDDELEKVS